MTGSIKKRPSGRWRARYRDLAGREYARHFVRKADAQRWLDEETADLVTGRYVAPGDRKITVEEWCETWLKGYATRESSIRQAKVHIARITQEFGPLPLSSVRASSVRSWMARLKREGLSDSYRFALHARLSQIMTDAVIDGLRADNPCSRRTSPGTGSQRAYVATEEQLWQLYEAAEPRYRPALLLGAFAGLRVSEACGLRVQDVDFWGPAITCAVQYGDKPLKTAKSGETIPISDTLATVLRECAAGRDEGPVLTADGEALGPWRVERHMRRIRQEVPGLSPEFRFHDLRHFYASLLIARGADVKVVQQRLRHASAKTTLDVYGHLWPDADQSTRTAIEAAMTGRIISRADPVRTDRDGE
ncbi:tyrosine-type recombinase/integrase [Streptomyces bohaiensis]|uniref:tyrosine-type recombinase/integrase n=1 Tax=Streptomyces bohaiensis TaxID=1431344 RepID=UPI003B827691